MVISIVGDYGYIKVNKRIVDVVIEWIKENKEQIVGYFDCKLVFVQIYLMINNQIKECYR